MRHRTLALATTILLATLTAPPATAQVDSVNPYTRANNSWITIDGTVSAVSPDTFLLDYGPGLITVEMDDGDRDADAYQLLKGDRVRVTGRVDDDLFEQRSIEASSVYVENLGTYFFSSAIDEEDWFVTAITPVDISETIIRGVVRSVDEDAFTLQTGLRSVRVVVDEMPYNPLDSIGYQRIRAGDYVSVAGHIDAGFFTLQPIFSARSILTLYKQREITN